MIDPKIKILVIPTDTIYGIVGSALDPEVVDKIYKLRKRNPQKPMIILISCFNDLNHFNVRLTKRQKGILEKIWPNPVTVIFPVDDKRFEYLHRGTKTLAFRMPKKDSLLKLLEKTGPMVAPSANFEGEVPAKNIEEARKFFGNEVDYIDEDTLESKPSTVIRFSTVSFPRRRESNYLWIPDQVGDDRLGFEILREGLMTKEEIKKLLE